jgi:hypothetical protein
MFDDGQRIKILEIWQAYSRSTKVVVDNKGNAIADFDQQREAAILVLRGLLGDYLGENVTVGQFKTSIDSYNKRNNYWGFTATKGQMFFNQLVRAGAGNLASLDTTLRATISAPASLDNALEKVGTLAAYCDGFFSKATDKRTAPNPGSVCYFLSYFWQIQDHVTWPIMYTSLIKSFAMIGIWAQTDSARDAYEHFYHINEGIEELIGTDGGNRPNHWEIEHAFWNFNEGLRVPQPSRPAPSSPPPAAAPPQSRSIEGAIDISEYLIPRIARLVELGADTEQSGARKGYLFEQMVAEVFRFFDFETINLGQGSGRNPDFIAKYREENTAFLVDAKAYSEGYSLGIDDRAMREYINSHCPELRKDGYKKIGFIVVSNSFKSDLDEFANELTWDTDIKRFILLESEALLYVLAYKTKDQLRPSQIIESLVYLGNPITKDKVIGHFEDV